MAINILLSFILIILTCLLHTIATRIILSHFRRRGSHISNLLKLLRIDFVVIVIIAFTFTEVFLWAGLYYIKDIFMNIEEAVYFSLVTFTTVGFGDIVLTEKYRLLAAFEAANGVLIFGWSTALLLAALQKTYLNK